MLRPLTGTGSPGVERVWAVRGPDRVARFPELRKSMTEYNTQESKPAPTGR